MKSKTEIDHDFEYKPDKDFTHQVITHLIGNFLIGCGVAVLLIIAVMSLTD